MDKRIARTRKSIKMALLELIEKKSAEKITVSEIAILAGIERKTFYLHYGCIEDVYLDIEKEISDELIEISNQYIQEPEYKIVNIFNNLNTVITKNLSFFKAVNKNDSYSFVMNSFEKILSSVILKISREIYKIKSKNMIYYSDYYAAGILSLYKKWLKDETDLTIEELTSILTRVIFLSVDQLKLDKD